MRCVLALVLAAFMFGMSTAQEPRPLRIGMIGLDTSHCLAFAKEMQSGKIPECAGMKVTIAYPHGSRDIESSASRIPGYTVEIKKLDVVIAASIEELLKECDCVLLETNDGRPHLEQALACFKAGKPTFIDKPVAGSLADAIAIARSAAKYRTPVFTSSALRFGKTTLAVRAGEIGAIKSCETFSPASLEKTHPDLFWYGIHGCESLFTVLGPKCETVKRDVSSGKIEVTGRWSGGAIGTFREGKGYGGKAIGEKGEFAVGAYEGYQPLVRGIGTFFRTGKPPVDMEESLAIYTFMEGADESKRRSGAEVTLAEVREKAESEATERLKQLDP